MESIHNTTLLTAELRALRRVSFSPPSGLKSIVIVMDSFEAVRALTNVCIPHNNLISDRRSLLEMVEAALLVHVYGEGNTVDDLLAKKARKKIS